MILLTARPALAMVVSDFNAGLCDEPMSMCWTSSSATFSLEHRNSGGNPDGYALLIDNAPGGAGGYAVAPT